MRARRNKLKIFFFTFEQLARAYNKSNLLPAQILLTTAGCDRSNRGQPVSSLFCNSLGLLVERIENAWVDSK